MSGTLLPFTSWESTRSRECPLAGCHRTQPTGTLFRWIPWLAQWVCPECAAGMVEEYDERMEGVASRAVAHVPAVPVLPETPRPAPAVRHLDAPQVAPVLTTSKQLGLFGF
jgi:hypothetical protein